MRLTPRPSSCFYLGLGLAVAEKMVLGRAHSMQTTNQHHQAGRGKRKRETPGDGPQGRSTKDGLHLDATNGPGQMSGALLLPAHTLGRAVLVVVLY